MATHRVCQGKVRFMTLRGLNRDPHTSSQAKVGRRDYGRETCVGGRLEKPWARRAEGATRAPATQPQTSFANRTESKNIGKRRSGETA